MPLFLKRSTAQVVYILLENFDLDFNAKGMVLHIGDKTLTLNWKRVAKRIGELISIDRYLNENEKKGYIEYSKKRNVDNLSTLSQTPTEEKDIFCNTKQLIPVSSVRISM